eukprot:4952456-Prymnesium_polylepis.1
MEWPHSNRRENDPPRFRGRPTGPRDEQHGCRPWWVQMQKKGPRRRGHRSPAAVTHTLQVILHILASSLGVPEVQSTNPSVYLILDFLAVLLPKTTFACESQPSVQGCQDCQQPNKAASAPTRCRLFRAIGVPHATLNFDALEYAPGNRGNVIRASVQELTGAVTFPQIFVHGKFIGGAAD